MENVIFKKEVLLYLEELVLTLFLQDYFGYEAYAQDYVDKIVWSIEKEIHFLPHKSSPKTLLYLGEFYIFYKVNRRTTWYILFERKANNYLINHILNNHAKNSQFWG